MNKSDNSLDKNIFDIDNALERIGNDREFLKELINIFREEFYSRIEQLKQAVSKKKFEAIKEIGHCLKGASANMSFVSLQRLSQQLEISGKDKNLSQAADLIPLLEKEFRKLQQHLKKLELLN